MKKITIVVIALICLVLIVTTVFSPKEDKVEKKQLLLYCGITMVKPMTEIINNFEKMNPNVNIIITQGGSQDLYNSLNASRKGDFYLPGSSSYRTKNIQDGLLGEYVTLGYNKAAIVVKKGNPKGFTNDLKALIDTKHAIGICNPESGSIGRMTKTILDKVGIYDEVYKKQTLLTTDSRNLIKAIKEGDVDVVMNWRTTALWPENRDVVEAIDLAEEYAPKQELQLIMLTFTKEPEISKDFLKYASSTEGKEIFTQWGF